MKIYIKNMVCGRCEMAVKNIFDEMKIAIQSIQLGEVEIATALDEKQRQLLSEQLKALGFELLDDKVSKTVERIKNLIIELVHYQNEKLKMNLSAYIADDLKQDYSALSNLFSETEGITIEHYCIAQKIERVKELLIYNELSLSQIAFQLNYSSVAHLSNQFKKTTGITPTQFKQLKGKKRKQLDGL
ncbi:helix-turn-helix domain-containing protein [Flavobacterium seoulense]|uniref:AraC family transcriptional reguator n=1 Tax=Flavobacterium seoulense TaxID=1492738 RepID=A0A066X159_9FLAO|nr:AraC family transcriptional regulator [Flavobacterium seoulense]KDN56879.1 AraC family transcriptional reguator [Flavobacterium seoulense]